MASAQVIAEDCSGCKTCIPLCPYQAILHDDAENRAELAVRGSTNEHLRKLTPREHEVMKYVISGLLNKQIGFALGIAEKTVKLHRARMMEKMGVVSVAELVRLTEKAGIQPASHV